VVADHVTPVAYPLYRSYLDPMRVPGRSGRNQSVIEASIVAVLDELRPLLRIDHCRMELVDFSHESGVAVVSMGGSCPDCDMCPADFSVAIEAHVRMRVPEVKSVLIPVENQRKLH
jgi:Fe-S cluster biogenesis protein NfuA